MQKRREMPMASPAGSTGARPPLLYPLLAVALVGLIVIAATLILVQPKSPGHNTTTLAGVRPETFSSPIASSGLQLRLHLNATTIPTGGIAEAQISLVNTLPRNLSLKTPYSSNTDIKAWDGFDFICGNNPAWGLVGFALYGSHITRANLSGAGDPLTLSPAVNLFSCVVWLYPDTVVFLRESSTVVGYYHGSSRPIGEEQARLNAADQSCVPQSGGSYLCGGVSSALLGYWDSRMPSVATTNATTSSGYFHPFQPGLYTLVGEDLWNQTVFAYLGVGSGTVVPGVSTSSISLQGFSLCPFDCIYPSPHLSGTIFFNGSAPLKSLQPTVNGTDEGVEAWQGTNLTSFAVSYKGGFHQPAVVKGDAYLLRFVATFGDGSEAWAETILIAECPFRK